MRPGTRSSKDRNSALLVPASKSECIKVVVRCRPMSDKENHQGHAQVVNINVERGTVELSKPSSSLTSSATANLNNELKIYTFDSVYDERSTQEDIYVDTFHSLVDSVLEGFNGTIFAYGQTGTGKTYTMEGTVQDPGVIPRSFGHIFDHIAQSSEKKFLVRSSYLEIYQEEIRDLLSSDTQKRLELREKSDIGVYVKDLSSFVCKNVQEIERVLAKGRNNRSIGSTNMNEHSSRSHAIFIITIEHSQNDDLGVELIRVGKLNLVDLAGSERQAKTKSIGQRQKEAIKINLSLSALGNVISALVDGRSTHIPYRDSKLTRLLQDSLGGNARTVMVANIGPAAYNYDETLITVRYANRAKNIKNSPRLNENPKDTLLKEFQAEIEKLRQQLQEKRNKKRSFGGDNAESTLKHQQQQQQIIDFEAAERLQAKISAMESKMLVGGKDIRDYTNQQQQELAKRMAELREQRQREKAMLRELEEHNEVTQEVRETFSSFQQEVDMKRRKLRKAIKEFQSVNSEIRDLHETHTEEREDLERVSNELIHDLKLRYLIIENFIPEHEKIRFLRNVYYDENVEEWRMKPTKSDLHQFANENGNLDSKQQSSQMADFQSQRSMMDSFTSSTSASVYPLSRPSSAFCFNNSDSSSVSNQQNSSCYSIFSDTNPVDCNAEVMMPSFYRPFHSGRIDDLGLYMPEPITLSYRPDISLTEDNSHHDDSDEDNLKIEIINLAEGVSNVNRAQTSMASTIGNRRSKQRAKPNWNETTIGKTPPPIRRSLTVMGNYSDNQYDENDQDEHRWLKNSDHYYQSSFDTNDINTLLDQKRTDVRQRLFQQQSSNSENIGDHSINELVNKQNLNPRPDTAHFPRSRGLVPK